MRTSLFLSLLLSALPAFGQPAQFTSTMCQTAEFPLGDEVLERRVVGCGAGFPENLLWHLDRSDSVDGTLDGKVVRRTTGRGAVIYVFDTGVLRDHDEFQRANGSNVIAGIDAGGHSACPDAVLAPCFARDQPMTVLLYGHGTGVASVAAGERTGVAPDASIVAVMYSDAESLLRALQNVIRHAYEPTTPDFRTAVINFSLSLSREEWSPDVDALIRRMVEGVDVNGNADPNGKRFLIVAAAGNYYEGRSNQCGADKSVNIYPALLSPVEGVIAVGGIDRANELWPGSCAGDLVEVLAPATDILVASLGANDSYRWKPDQYVSGTSWSSPFVAGMAARLLERDPNQTPAQLEAALKQSESRVAGLPVAVLTEPPPASAKRRVSRH